jgi:hypothetical protein
MNSLTLFYVDSKNQFKSIIKKFRANKVFLRVEIMFHLQCKLSVSYKNDNGGVFVIITVTQIAYTVKATLCDHPRLDQE